MSRGVTHSLAIVSLLATCAAQKRHPCRFSGISEVATLKASPFSDSPCSKRVGKSELRSSFPTATNRYPVSFSHTRPSAAPTTIATCCALPGHWLGPEQLPSFWME
jgi:hypothetical protein